MTLSDGELIERVAVRDEAAFELLCANYAEPLRRHLLRMLRSPDTAEDLLQETLLRVWTHADQWDGRGAVRAWLFRIATSVALNALRMAQRRPQAPITLPSDSDATLSFWLTDTSMSPQEAIERSEERARSHTDDRGVFSVGAGAIVVLHNRYAPSGYGVLARAACHESRADLRIGGTDG
ncbi:MAG: sigma-70 family RNA polymerase sigma factor [Roseiflexaceae bacterium]|nr:sigma-70 family RNA polymerase sigma factor [Roseiflexaceae bacterium]